MKKILADLISQFLAECLVELFYPSSMNVATEEDAAE